eukprot:TRINITY_DN3124_c0_g2_i1.p1 TRINITY_DN3124_c0_g2~~TRINITY_DN3124_c0_g2_i1.p1  ORF type:complete len:563 (+),score=120.34 TRINITY_DN3124_c0_g2_i1:47-1735(+)
MATMEDTYRGQHIFITGSTGFVGKVLVEKILRCLPGVEKIYLLIREKKDVKPKDRLQKELLDSAAMNKLREIHGGEENFNKFAHSKLVPVVGSLTDDQLGMSNSDYQTLLKKCSMILHLAATIDFNETLCLSTKLNILGSLQVLSLARKCHKRGGFDGFVHMSTCYVNYQRNGGSYVDETLYPLPFDAEVMCKNILNYDPEQLLKDTPDILAKYGFPNTYTMTKSMSEHLLNVNRGTVPMTIVRPSIIGSSLLEPYPGWVDTLSASGALFLTSGFGIVQEVHADPKAKADIVPVDFVVKGTLLAAARLSRETRVEGVPSSGGATEETQRTSVTVTPLTAGNLEKAGDSTAAVVPVTSNIDIETKSTTTIASAVDPVKNQPRSMQVYQFATSATDNPLTWGMVVNYVRNYWVKYPPKNQIRDCKVRLFPSRVEYESRFLIKRSIPTSLFYAQSRLPFPGARPNAVKMADKLKKATGRAYDLVTQFRAFNNKTWDYGAANTNSLHEILNTNEMGDWEMDCHHISWNVYIANYCYGLMKFVLKEDVEEPHKDHINGALLYARSNL